MGQERKPVKINVYDKDGHYYSSLVDVAKPLFDQVNIPTEWTDVHRLPKEQQRIGLAPKESLGLRVQPGRPSYNWNAGQGHAVLGGVMASIYPDALTAGTARVKNPQALTKLPGNIAAHEIGHLLFGTHTKRGLMRGNWSPEEINANRPEDWSFSLPEMPVLFGKQR